MIKYIILIAICLAISGCGQVKKNSQEAGFKISGIPLLGTNLVEIEVGVKNEQKFDETPIPQKSTPEVVKRKISKTSNNTRTSVVAVLIAIVGWLFKRRGK